MTDQLDGLVCRVNQDASGFIFSIHYEGLSGGRRWYRVGSVKRLAYMTQAQWFETLRARLRAIKKDAVAARAKIDKGEDPQAQREMARKEKIEAPSRLLRAFVEQTYAPQYLAHRRSGDATKNRLLASFIDLLDRDIDKLTRWDFEKWRSARRATGITPETINRDVNAMRSMLNWALRNDLIDENPLAGVKALEQLKDDRVRYLDPDERSRLLAAMDARGGFMRPLVLLALNTGMRRGEMLSLTWGAVDLEERRITLKRTDTKANKTRHIPLNNTATDALTGWMPEKAAPGLLVFPNGAGNQRITVKREWGALVNSADIADFRFHDCRHDFASRLVMAGTDLNTVRELLGHSDLAMTLRYAHLAPEHKAMAVAALDLDEPESTGNVHQLNEARA